MNNSERQGTEALALTLQEVLLLPVDDIRRQESVIRRARLELERLRQDYEDYLRATLEGRRALLSGTLHAEARPDQGGGLTWAASARAVSGAEATIRTVSVEDHRSAPHRYDPLLVVSFGHPDSLAKIFLSQAELELIHPEVDESKLGATALGAHHS